MYCINCGKENHGGDIYCGGCGKLINSNQQVNSIVQPIIENNIKPKSPLIPILIFIGVLFIGVVCAFLCLFNFISSYDYRPYEQTESYVYLDRDVIPTIYNLMGEYDLCYSPDYVYDDEIIYVEYTYCDDYMLESVFYDYLGYLVDDYGFVEYEDESAFYSVYKDSSDDGYIIIVQFDEYSNSIMYLKEKIDYEEDNFI